MFQVGSLSEVLFTLTTKTNFLVAYSGGMDSHVLLHAMVSLKQCYPSFQVRAVHVHHGLSPNADNWVSHCQKKCRELEIACLVKKIQVQKQSKSHHSIEALAREARYEVCEQLLNEDECLLTAQHADDQAETVLLQLFRGAGVKGLAAMPESKPFGKSVLLRPLLGFTHDQLKQYALAYDLQWVEDESNENIGIDRNFVRHKLLPLISSRWLNVSDILNRAAKNCAQAEQILEEVACHDYESVLGSKPNTLAISKLIILSDIRKQNVIRFWLKKLSFAIPSKIKITHIISDVVKSRVDAKACVHWRGTEVRRYRDDLYVLQPIEKKDFDFLITWDGFGQKKLPDDFGVIEAKILQNKAIKFSSNDGEITLGTRQNFHSFEVKERKGTFNLKNLFQEWGVVPWHRPRTILFFQQQKLIGYVIL